MHSWTLWSLIASAVATIATAAIAVVVLVRLPADAFLVDTAPRLLGRRSVLRVLSNVLGWSLIAVGVVLSVPGVPGQGVLTMLIGLLMVEFPGRARLLRRILRRPGIRRRLDGLRLRFRRPPFLWNAN